MQEYKSEIIRLIPYKVCPQCGARPIAESCRHYHVNGQGFESRTFSCGAIFEWIPNFEELRNSALCPLSPEQLAIKKKRIEAVAKIKEFLVTLDADKEVFKQMNFTLSHLMYGFSD